MPGLRTAVERLTDGGDRRTDQSVVDQLPACLDPAAKQRIRRAGEHQVFLPCQREKMRSFSGSRRKRLFHICVLSCQKSLLGKPEMTDGIDQDHNNVKFHGQQFFCADGVGNAELCRPAPCAFPAAAADSHDLCVPKYLCERMQIDTTDVSTADHTDFASIH